MRCLPFALAASFAAASLTVAPALRAQRPAIPGAPTSAVPADSARDAAAQDSMRGHTRLEGLGAATDRAARDSALVARLDSVDAAAKSGLTDLPASAAVALIEAIEAQLRESSRPALRSIVRDLSALRAELGAERVDGRRVGVILRRIGPKVTTVSRTQSGPMRATLQSIGQELTTAGQQLVSRAAGPPAGAPR